MAMDDVYCPFRTMPFTNRLRTMPFTNRLLGSSHVAIQKYVVLEIIFSMVA